MALKFGFEAIKYVLTKALTKKGSQGIATIPGKAYDMRMKELVDAMATKMRDLGYDVNKVTEKEVKGLLDSAEALEKQKTKKASDDLIKFFDETAFSSPKKKSTPKVYKKGDEGYDEITEKLGITARPGHPLTLEGKADLKVVPKVTVDEHITFIKSKDPIESMKEANKVIKREGRYKNLTNDESQKILKDTDDHIFERDIKPDEFDPDYASGGRVPLMYGGDPGFAFEYGGSWADWHEKHRDTMPVEQYIQTKLPKERLPFREMEEGGRAGFPFGGRALKAIRDAFRANKTWGVGGPPYRPEKTSFDIKALTKENLGKEFTLKELKEVSESPFADFASRGQGRAPPTFNEFNKEFKIIKARVLKTKLEESKAQAEAMMESAKVVPADNPTAKKVQAQFTRDGKKQLEEAIEGLKEIDIYMGMLQKKGRSLHQSGGLAYMLGEPTYMKYSAGGSVGHAPWLKPTAQQQPQQQLDTPPPQVGGGRPNPMKAPRGLPSLAPRTMDPAYMQQQMMQKAMMGQQRPGMEEGGITPTIPEQFLEDFKRRKYEDILDEYHRWKEDYERRKDLAPTQEAAGGGRIGFGLGSMSRRAFLKMMAAVAAVPLVGKGVTKVAPKVIPKVTETVARGADGMPAYITNLIEVVKAKGTKDIIEGFKRSDYSTVHSYKGVDVIEEAGGTTRIKKSTEGVAEDASTGKMHEGTSKEIEMEIIPGKVDVIDEGTGAQRSFQTTDEYFEGTVRPDMDGKMKDFEEFIDESDHLELKKIADELHADDFYYPLDAGEKLKGKASGGLAYMLGE